MKTTINLSNELVKLSHSTNATKQISFNLFGKLFFVLRFVVILFVSAVAVFAQSDAVQPVPRLDGWWTSRFVTSIVQMDKGNIDLLMIGDSITHGWENQGKDIWNEYYTKRNAINLGISGDRTQHVLWRLDHLPLNKISPKAAVVMIGTNNIGGKDASPKDTADGIKTIVDRLQKQFPDIKIILLNVFPRGEKPEDGRRKLVDEINSYLPNIFKEYKNVKLLDINHVFLDENKILPKSIMPDSLHPNKDGYKLWAEAVEPSLVEIFGK
ncbi:MAG: GDSL-type esterase/lipase family protein [Planctomycetaceae bacterium]|jgi:beta-glucosidase|nr:GDSL-type esterase/lipase family protein [Planctomycetaceae bacterium]